MAVGLVIFIGTREPRRPGLPKWEVEERMMEQAVGMEKLRKQREADVALVRGLLAENLGERQFDFSLVVAATSGKRVLPLDGRVSQQRVLAAIDKAMGELVVELSAGDSPVREMRRINEGSRFFEEGLMGKLNAVEGLSCEVPLTRSGVAQRSGYPDLRVVDEESGEVFYLDPKLVEEGSVGSSFRTFYFEPKGETLKITDDAVHLLVGIEHDGKVGEWNFLRWRVVDLSKLRVRLKAEFQASNRDLYSGAEVRGD